MAACGGVQGLVESESVECLRCEVPRGLWGWIVGYMVKTGRWRIGLHGPGSSLKRE